MDKINAFLAVAHPRLLIGSALVAVLLLAVLARIVFRVWRRAVPDPIEREHSAVVQAPIGVTPTQVQKLNDKQTEALRSEFAAIAEAIKPQSMKELEKLRIENDELVRVNGIHEVAHSEIERSIALAASALSKVPTILRAMRRDIIGGKADLIDKAPSPGSYAVGSTSGPHACAAATSTAPEGTAVTVEPPTTEGHQ